jgi:hypothetical protein
VIYRSDLDSFGEDGEAEEEEPDIAGIIEIPHNGDLDLGRDLVHRFVERVLPGDVERVDKMFHKRGAYGRFKELLAERGKLDQWYEFEAKAEEKALRRWCALEGVPLLD